MTKDDRKELGELLDLKFEPIAIVNGFIKDEISRLTGDVEKLRTDSKDELSKVREEMIAQFDVIKSCLHSMDDDIDKNKNDLAYFKGKISEIIKTHTKDIQGAHDKIDVLEKNKLAQNTRAINYTKVTVIGVILFFVQSAVVGLVVKVFG